MKVIISIDCTGPTFEDDDGNLAPEQGVEDLLCDIVELIRSGTQLVDLHCHRLRCAAGEEAAVILVSV